MCNAQPLKEFSISSSVLFSNDVRKKKNSLKSVSGRKKKKKRQNSWVVDKIDKEWVFYMKMSG